MSKTKFERARIPLTRIAGGLGLLVICLTKSVWETKSELIAVLLFCIGAVLAAVASMGRMWCSLYIAGNKDKMLVTEGPYSLSRNPLYFFNMLGAVGVGFATETFTFPVLILILFGFYYPQIIRREAVRLKELFGEQFEKYRQSVPAFFPRFAGFTEPDRYEVRPVVYRKHIASALWFIWLLGIMEIVEGLNETGILHSQWTLF
jgi:protein-S-isoprenylcysteine O-methyltransferase Ste14